MRALILNLADQTERMGVMAAQMAHFAFDYERVEAVTPVTLARPADDPYWQQWQRPMRDTEKAVLESHQKAWKRVMQLDVPCLILEDDALLAEGTAALLNRVRNITVIDHLTLEARGRKKLVGKKLGELPLRRLYLDRTGAAAYVLWPSGARKLLAHTATAGQLADGAICSAYNLNSFQADPALAIQMDRCDYYNVPQPIAVKSTIDVQRKPHDLSAFTRAQRRAFRQRRIGAQLRMGLRQLTHLGRARREMVPLAPHWPDLTPKRDA
ncbi:MAG: glycosyltransferase family 25 protein [Brevirhabdus sp.]